MRRGSVVGPLLLIAIGGLFLANNLRPELNFFELLAQYWPLLLIIWGLLRLVEIGVWYARRQPLPQRGLSGGEWTAIVFICLLGTSAFAVHRHWGSFGPMRIRGLEMFGEPHDYDVELRTVPSAGKTPRIIVENLRGNARIVGADAEEVRVSGHKTIRSMRREDADRANALTPVEVTNQGGVIVVRTNQERADSRQRVHTDLEITIPRGAAVECRGRYGDFDVTDVLGDVEIQTDNTGIRAQNLGGNLKADLRRSDIIRAINVKGTVDLRVTGQSDALELENIEGPVTINGSYYEVQLRKFAKPVRFDGYQTDFRVERINGQVRMTPNTFEADNISGPVSLSSSRPKDVTITDATDTVTVEMDRGDIEVRSSKPVLPKMNLRTHNGNITLTVPEDAKFAIRGNTNRGEVQNEYGTNIQVSATDASATFSGGTSGAPEIVITTGRGDITLRKATGELLAKPATPEPPEPPAPEQPKKRKLDLKVEKS